MLRSTGFVLLLLSSFVCADEVILEQQQFVEQAFAGVQAPVKMQTLWIDKDLKQQILEHIDYHLHGLRVRYWLAGARTAWVLEEIGKERPITMGMVVENNKLIDVKILVYRESRGGEVRHDFFTRQFSGAELQGEADPYALDKSIDNITGATLSVRAVKKVATLALFLHQQVTQVTHVSQEKH